MSGVRKIRSALQLLFAGIWLLSSGPLCAQTDYLDDVYRRVAALNSQGKTAEAFVLLETMLLRAESVYGVDHPVLSRVYSALSQIYRQQGRAGEAEAILQKFVDFLERTRLQDDVELANVLGALANVRVDLRRAADAEAPARRGAQLYERLLGPQDIATAISLSNLCNILKEVGKLAEADRQCRRAIASIEAAQGPNGAALPNALEIWAMVALADRRPGEGIEPLQRAIAIQQKSPVDVRVDLARQHLHLGFALKGAGRISEAKSAIERHVEVVESLYGADHPKTADAIIELTGFLMSVFNTPVEVLAPLSERVITIRTNAFGPEAEPTLQALEAITVVRQLQGRMAEAEQILRQTVEVTERNHGAPLDLSRRLSNLALLVMRDRPVEAESLNTRALELLRSVLGEEHPQIGEALFNLAQGKVGRGLYPEAEELLQRALRIQEATLGDDPAVAMTLGELAMLIGRQGRTEQARPLLERALEIRLTTSGESMYSATVLLQLAEVNVRLNRLREAESAAQRGLSIMDKLGVSGWMKSVPRAVLGRIYLAQGRAAEAEANHLANLADVSAALGADNVMVRQIEADLARLYDVEKRYAQALPIQKRVLAAYEAAFGPDAEETVLAANNLAWIQSQLGQNEDALQTYERASAGWVRRRQLELAVPGAAAREQQSSELVRYAYTFANHVRTAYRVMQATPPDSPRSNELIRRSFELAQWANLTEAAAALAQMSARVARGSGSHAQMLRRYQDLNVQWRVLDQRLFDALKIQASERKPAEEQDIRSRISAVSAALTDLRGQIEKALPAYAEMAFVKPVPVRDIQNLLNDDEILVQFFSWDDETYIWIVRKQGSTWARRKIGLDQMFNRVAALRCGLDGELWQSARSRLRCRALLGKKLVPRKPGAHELPPFDLELAYDTYKELLGGALEERTRNKRLLIVPSGPLAQLPFEVLLTSPPPQGVSTIEALGQASWLGVRQSITVLPSVSALKALRGQARKSAARRPLVGFANPLLDGPDSSFLAKAKLARERTGCEDKLQRLQVASADHASRGGLHAKRSAHAARADLASQLPLPDTVDEICAVAASVDAKADDLFIGGRATEARVKQLSASGDLADYKVLHFATHGALAGEIGGVEEPGLVLTPPATPSSQDDGYLSASEIAELKLDADWVILSACNTAAGGVRGAEALSGIARAFFYAGARSLLVSHWSVYSSAAVDLVTSAFGELRTSPSISRAEAMRRARAAVSGRGGFAAHPAYWAPFSLVGEGEARR